MFKWLDSLPKFLRGIRRATDQSVRDSVLGSRGHLQRPDAFSSDYKLIEELRERSAEVRELCDKHVRMSQSTERCDREAAERSVAGLYQQEGLPVPPFVWFDSPKHAYCAAVICKIMEGALRIAPPTPTNKLVFSGEALVRQIAIGSDKEELSDRFQRLALMSVPNANRAPLLRFLQQEFRLRELQPRHNDLILLYTERLLAEVAKGKPLDMWIDAWIEVPAKSRHANDDFKAKWEIFGEIFSALPDEEQAHLIQWSAADFFQSWASIIGSRRDLLELDCLYLLHEEPDTPFVNFRETAMHCGWWQPREIVCFMVDRPVQLHLDANREPHRENGPAIEYSDGFKVYALQGVLVNEDIAYGGFAAESIDRNPNVEQRRVMIDRYGIHQYLVDTHAEIINTDEFGCLYRKHVPGNETIVMVKVTNSTAEPDGSYKEYFLRVPPGMTTAREAIAWTFGMDAKEYSPSLES